MIFDELDVAGHISEYNFGGGLEVAPFGEKPVFLDKPFIGFLTVADRFHAEGADILRFGWSLEKFASHSEGIGGDS